MLCFYLSACVTSLAKRSLIRTRARLAFLMQDWSCQQQSSRLGRKILRFVSHSHSDLTADVI